MKTKYYYLFKRGYINVFGYLNTPVFDQCITLRV